MIVIESQNRVCWVTGAAGSIGRATSFLLGEKKHDLVISDMQSDKLERLSAELRETFNIKVLPLPLDVSDFEMVAGSKKRIDETFGRLDVLVNGAGISPKSPNGRIHVEEMPIEQWNKVIGVNLTGAMICSQIAIPYMKRNKKGHIVNISSQAGRSYSPITGAHYAVSKAGLIALTRQMAGELGPDGIHVNAIAPGRIDTPMIHDVPEEVNRQAISNIPLRRLGTPEDVARTISFLISEQSSYITGTVIDINGGRLMM